MTSKLEEKPSALNRKNPALQNMKFLSFFYFCWFFFAGSNLDLEHWSRHRGFGSVRRAKETELWILTTATQRWTRDLTSGVTVAAANWILGLASFFTPTCCFTFLIWLRCTPASPMMA
jgi:hypothetical protein